MAEKIIRLLYIRFIRPLFSQGIHLQRLKLAWFVWGYLPLLTKKTLSASQRLDLLYRCLRIDWNVQHSHRPCEIAAVISALASRRAKQGEVLVEAGCWNGGSSAKFSIACKMLGYHTRIYDSFEGVGQLSEEEKNAGFDFSGQYAASQSAVAQTLSTHGEMDVCSFYPGWFSDTLAKSPVNSPVRVVYIDCDTANGTKDVLAGVLPAIVPDGVIFTQDFHIASVKELLNNAATWKDLNVPPPKIRYLCGNLSILWFDNANH